MIHPIFSVLISKPELVMEHVSGYAALVREEASTAGLEVAKRAIAWGVTTVGALLFPVLAGVAAMLGALHGFHWTLVVVPGIALAMAVGGFMAARKRMPAETFTELKAQIDADARALRAIGARS
ncbi:hypothetical protein HK414_05885 [Ramlibacter terrae]|uniref:Phage holin family protein n=1 Tax=Ramlibacter terrae TaxID=2732511 RepID=A0ABX6P6P4_9BURK|nr:hypothetical protein HK414_05885 [Ramlibacter terrae]